MIDHQTPTFLWLIIIFFYYISLCLSWLIFFTNDDAHIEDNFTDQNQTSDKRKCKSLFMHCKNNISIYIINRKKNLILIFNTLSVNYNKLY